MSFTALSPNWQMTALFFLTLLPLCLLMKWVAFRGTPEAKDPLAIFSIFPTPAALRRCLPLSAAPRLLRRSFLTWVVCIGAYWLCVRFIQEFRPPTIFLSYLGAIILWLVSEAFGSLIPFLGLPSRRLLPLPHGPAPPLATSLADFWGRRWNIWTSEWFRQIIFRPLQTRPVLALFLVFLISGVFHEWAINFPLYLVTGKKYFGSMILYFLLQAIGILIEHKMRNRIMRIFMVWLFVFGAAPLIVNEGMLRILHLWPE